MAPITPGKGAGDDAGRAHFLIQSAGPQQPAPSGQAPSNQVKDQCRPHRPRCPTAGEGVGGDHASSCNVNFVEVPVTVKDSKGIW